MTPIDIFALIIFGLIIVGFSAAMGKCLVDNENTIAASLGIAVIIIYLAIIFGSNNDSFQRGITEGRLHPEKYPIITNNIVDIKVKLPE